MTEILDNQASEKNSEFYMASKLTRFINFFIDRFIAILLAIGATFVVQKIELIETLDKPETQDTHQFIVFSVMAIVYIGYYTLMEYSLGKTVGKLITQTEVITLDESHPSLLNCLGRSLGRLIPFNAISFLFAERGIHDVVSLTYVVSRKK